MNIRMANVEDCESIAKISINSWKKTYKGIIDCKFLDKLDHENKKLKYIDRIKNKEKILVICNDVNDVKGFCWFGNSNDNNKDTDGEIYAIYLDNDSIGKGYGSMLFDSAITILNTENKKNIIIWCLNGNFIAKNFYLYKKCYFYANKKIIIGNQELLENSYIYHIIN